MSDYKTTIQGMSMVLEATDETHHRLDKITKNLQRLIVDYETKYILTSLDNESLLRLRDQLADELKQRGFIVWD